MSQDFTSNFSPTSGASGVPLQMLNAAAEIGFASSADEILEKLCRAIVEAQLFREAVAVISDENFMVAHAGLFADESQQESLRLSVKTWIHTPLRPYLFAYHSERVHQSYLYKQRNPEQLQATTPWSPADQLVTAMSVPGGRVLGFVSVCRPHTGQAPSLETVRLIELISKHATAHLIQRAALEELGQSRDEAEARLLERSHELRAAQEKFSRLVNTISDVVIVVDEQLSITYLNEAFSLTLGIPREEMLGRNLRWLLEEITSNAVQLQEVSRLLDVGDPATRTTRLTVRTSAGDTRTLDVKIGPSMSGKAGKGLVILARDQTEREALFDHLLASDKLAASGRVAATIAHEINNPLQAILTQIGSLQETLGMPASSAGPIERMREAVDRIRLLSRSMLDLSRPARGQIETLSINGIANTVVTLLRGELQKLGIENRLTLDPTEPTIRAERGAIEQMLLNVILNAMEAMPNGGDLIIETSSHESAVEVIVRDGGTGISADISPNIFDAFVTSKPNGSGLGLYICKGIADRMGAEITVLKTGSEGTAIALKFPISE